MNLYSEHYWNVKKYKQNFEEMIEQFHLLQDFDEKLNFATYIPFIFKNLHNA